MPRAGLGLGGSHRSSVRAMGLTATSFTNEFKQFLTLVARSGPTEGARIVIRELGFRTRQSMSYPGIGRRFVVEFDPVWRWTQKGVREPGVLKFAQDRIGRGSTVFDVGAHMGEWTLLFSELVGPSRTSRRVRARPCRARLPQEEPQDERHFERHGGGDVRERQDGEGTSPGREVRERALVDRPTARPMAVATKSSKWRRRRSTSIARRAPYLPDWIKIDAEGSEPLIVRGMQRLIRGGSPAGDPGIPFRRPDRQRRRARRGPPVTERASSVEFLQSRLRNHVYLEKLSEGYVPDCGFLVVHVAY